MANQGTEDKRKVFVFCWYRSFGVFGDAEFRRSAKRHSGECLLRSTATPRCRGRAKKPRFYEISTPAEVDIHHRATQPLGTIFEPALTASCKPEAKDKSLAERYAKHTPLLGNLANAIAERFFASPNLSLRAECAERGRLTDVLVSFLLKGLARTNDVDSVAGASINAGVRFI
jgi:hypothetical protein